MALTLGMAFHELATNAAKHGALSMPAGRVRVSWQEAEADGRAPAPFLEWRESNGPPVRPPERRGFGSRLIQMGIAHELGGEVRLDFDPSGLRCTMNMPLRDTGQAFDAGPPD